MELCPVETGRYFGEKIDDGRIDIWITKLPDDPARHVSALAYASDCSLLDAVMARYGRTRFDKRINAHKPGSHDVVSSSVPRRRMAALRARFAKRARWTRSHAGTDLQGGWHVGCLRGTGALYPRATLNPHVHTKPITTVKPHWRDDRRFRPVVVGFRPVRL